MNAAQISKIAKILGLKVGKGTYNGSKFWTNEAGQIVTAERVLELAGY